MILQIQHLSLCCTCNRLCIWNYLNTKPAIFIKPGVSTDFTKMKRGILAPLDLHKEERSKPTNQPENKLRWNSILVLVSSLLPQLFSHGWNSTKLSFLCTHCNAKLAFSDLHKPEHVLEKITLWWRKSGVLLWTNTKISIYEHVDLKS